jgi:hypothetical protein
MATINEIVQALEELQDSVTILQDSVEDLSNAVLENVQLSEQNAATSASNALLSEQNAEASASSVLLSEQNATTSASNALLSEQNAATSEINALLSEQNAEASASNALSSEQNALSATTETLEYKNQVEAIVNTLPNFFDPSIIALNERGTNESAIFGIKLRFVQQGIDNIFPIEPKLYMYPAVYKIGKLYSAIPSDGSGDFSVKINNEDALPLVDNITKSIEFLPNYEITLLNSDELISNDSGEIIIVAYFDQLSLLDVEGASAIVFGLTNIRFSYSPTNIKLYINNILKYEINDTFDFSNLSFIELGHYNGLDQFDGKISDVIII